MIVTHPPPTSTVPTRPAKRSAPAVHPLWATRGDRRRRGGRLMFVVIGVLLLVAIVIWSGNTESTGPLTVGDATQKLAQVCDGGSDGVTSQGSLNTYGATRALQCPVNGELVYLYLFPYSVDAESVVSAASVGSQGDVLVVGPNWIAKVALVAPGTNTPGDVAKLVQAAFGGTIQSVRRSDPRAIAGQAAPYGQWRGTKR
jgi:hypothetical protein